MNLYFEFEARRHKAEVVWPKSGQNITVYLDKELVNRFPSDLFFEIKGGNKVSYIIESNDDKRLLELQFVLSRRLQELVNK